MITFDIKMLGKGKNTKMLRHCPLYDMLLGMAKMDPDKTLDIKCICTTINNIAQVLSVEEANFHYTNIGMLAIHHDLLTNDGLLLSPIPYGGKVMINNKGILYNTINLPVLLQQIISKYLEYYS